MSVVAVAGRRNGGERSLCARATGWVPTYPGPNLPLEERRRAVAEAAPAGTHVCVHAQESGAESFCARDDRTSAHGSGHAPSGASRAADCGRSSPERGARSATLETAPPRAVSLLDARRTEAQSTIVEKIMATSFVPRRAGATVSYGPSLASGQKPLSHPSTAAPAAASVLARISPPCCWRGRWLCHASTQPERAAPAGATQTAQAALPPPAAAAGSGDS